MIKTTHLGGAVCAALYVGAALVFVQVGVACVAEEGGGGGGGGG